MNRCQVKSVKSANSDEIEFKFSGSIDESLVNYLAVFPMVPKMTLNLDEVESINSTGIREWIKLMNKLNTSKIKITFCPKTFIDQVNMVKGFIPEYATIESFYVPYFSETNNLEKKILFEKGKHFGDSFVNYENTITEDGVSYEIDVVTSKFFKFIKI